MSFGEIELSDYGRASSIPSPVNRMTSAFANDFRPEIDINLGVGYVNEDTMPRRAIQDALNDIPTHPNQYPAALNYGGAKGAQNLIEAIRTFTLHRNSYPPYGRSCRLHKKLPVVAQNS
ncbi:MAG: hypothetical protein QGG64_07205 [Candidatus Latescibacteria bacterium]|jgi:DNA-binding transcriptional MocR family regulator|nr:hypothetical protein [Candidatus Latescibacterota bacterium]|tara:strand:- start:18 stop:374 length:357 start_codon:yes stop_codon:yes gene_type:complete